MPRPQMTRFLRVAAAVLVVGVVATACSSSASGGSANGSSGGSANPSKPAALVPMKFALQQNLNAVNFWVAEDEGYFKAAGIAPTIVPVDIGFNGVQLAASGQVQGGGCSSFPMLNIFAKTPSISVVAVYATVTAQKIIAKNSIQTPADLIGKKVGITAGSVFEFSFAQYLEQNNVPVNQVKIVPVDAADQAAALKRGDVDAVVNVDPTASQALAALGSGGHLLSPGIDFKDRVYLQMTQSYVAAHGAAVQDALKALVQASQFVKSNPQQAYQIVGKHLNLDPATVAKQMGNGWNFDVSLGQDAVQEAKDTQDFMVSHALLKTPVDVDKLFDPQPLRTVDASLVYASS